MERRGRLSRLRAAIVAGLPVSTILGLAAGVGAEEQSSFLFLRRGGSGACTSWPPACPPPSSPCAPLLTKPELPSTGSGAQPGAQPGAAPGDAAAQSPNVQLGAESAGAGGGDTFAVAAPNMIGDLLYNSRSVQFGFLRANGNTNIFSLGSTSAVNASVAENNSPVPADRIYVRYNYFAKAQSVTGIGDGVVTLAPPDGTFPGVFAAVPDTKKYDTNLFTFGGEKTFFNGLMSIELRLPVVTSLSPRNIFAVGAFQGFNGGFDANGNPTFDVLTTPENTLGTTGTYFGNMTVIGKALLWADGGSGLYVSGGTGVGIPTAPNTHIRVIDYASTAETPSASSQRLKDISIDNDTVGLTPFFAALWAPGDRSFFTQGFLAVDVPLNPSPIIYGVRQIRGEFPAAQDALNMGSLRTPFYVRDHIREQTLIHVDWGTGYWLYRQPNSDSWLTGIAPTLEVHYTGALSDADRVQLPGDASARQFDPNDPIGAFNRDEPQVPELGPVVGSPRKRVNIVNLTAGTTFLVGQRTTVATAFAVPVTNSFNKTFDWEFQLQLNHYFGAGQRLARMAPNLQ